MSFLIEINQEYVMKIKYTLLIPIVLLLVLCGCSLNDRKATPSGDSNYIKAILSKDPDRINSKDEYGNSLLHLAAREGNVDIINYLVSEGANVNSRNIADETPIHLAANSGNLDVVIQLISNGANINVKDSIGNTPLHDAAENDHIQIVKYLISQKAEINTQNNGHQSPLHEAVEFDKVEMSKLLVSEGANVNTQDEDRRSPLHAAVVNENLELVKYLTANGAEVNAKDKFDRTPLHQAAYVGNLDVVKHLILQGSDIDEKGAFYLHLGKMELTLNCTPLHIAAKNGHFEVVKFLVYQGADVNLKNNDGDSVLDLAQTSGHTESIAFIAAFAEKNAQIENANDILESSAKKPYSDIDFGPYHALVIGNNNYQYLPKLIAAKNDAQEVARALRNRYGFKTELLIDANRSDVLLALLNLRNNLTERDNLLIYYAGHGWLDKEADEGYWLPIDAEKSSMINWISNSSITTLLRAIRAKHVLIVADSCYSGKLARGIHTVNRTSGYLSRLSQKRARCVISSGGLEPVVDSGGKGEHSVFASAFLAVLRGNEKVLDGAQLFNKLRRPVMLNSDQTPEYSDIHKAGHEGGEFLFVKVK
jgi:ankyrin repeat protein